MSKPVMIRCDALAGAGNRIAHAFFTRQGGKSTGIYAGLNAGLGSRDDRDNVLTNRSRAISALADECEFLATPHQTHSTDVLAVNEPWPEGTRPMADGIVTGKPGIALGILTADCGPVLFSDPEEGVIGAAHAGWKGALGGILENTVEAMEELGATRNHIVAILGPTISSDNYEVGPEFVDRFIEKMPQNRRFFSESVRQNHYMFDLPAYIVTRLEAAGVSARWVGECTYGDEDRFFSYRRATHRNEPDYGRQLSAIMLRN